MASVAKIQSRAKPISYLVSVEFYESTFLASTRLGLRITTLRPVLGGPTKCRLLTGNATRSNFRELLAWTIDGDLTEAEANRVLANY